MLKLWKWPVPFLGINQSNTIIATDGKFLNPKAKFNVVHSSGEYYAEPMAHEFVDKLGSVLFPFVGHLVFKGTNHTREKLAMEEIQKRIVPY